MSERDQLLWLRFNERLELKADMQRSQAEKRSFRLGTLLAITACTLAVIAVAVAVGLRIHNSIGFTSNLASLFASAAAALASLLVAAYTFIRSRESSKELDRASQLYRMIGDDIARSIKDESDIVGDERTDIDGWQ